MAVVMTAVVAMVMIMVVVMMMDYHGELACPFEL